MKKSTRKFFAVPVALAAASVVALTSSPASAAVITVNVGTSAIPQNAGCVFVTELTTDSIVQAKFTPGSTARISGLNVQAGDRVHFDWRDVDCGPTTIRHDFHFAPKPLPTVWNIN